MNSERVHELQLLAMGLGGPSAMLSARRNSNESGFVKKISREGGGAQKFHHDFLSHLGPCSLNWELIAQGSGEGSLDMVKD